MELKLDFGSIRSFRRGDLDSLVRHANDREVWLNLKDRFPHPYTKDDARAWLQLVTRMEPETSFAIAVDDVAVGGIGIEPQGDVARRSAEIGYWLGREFWGRGIATSALRAMTDWAFANFEICRLHAGVFAWNPASARVLEKAGYTLEGRLRSSVFKDGHMTDQLLYAIVREPDEAEFPRRAEG
ncbi:GNAT family N-acetyltransferase [Singulisphaera sp. PoT]|uniref:GNAT family N-acetyltransferase n=1 Tax=Singulisphaera sp. PoT TaxID=3411797 RepID=UPI003BF4EEE6